MLTADKLRIGNWIYLGNKYASYARVLQIGDLEAKFEQVYCECSESFEWAFNGNYRGIPITSEILEKCGFVKQGFGYWLSINTFSKGSKFLFFSGDYLYIQEGSKDMPTPEDDIVTLWNKDLKKEFYLHELQNLYYLIIGEELKINLFE